MTLSLHWFFLTFIQMKIFNKLCTLFGQQIGILDWFTVDQYMIDEFADVTNGKQFIYIDSKRAKSLFESALCMFSCCCLHWLISLKVVLVCYKRLSNST